MISNTTTDSTAPTTPPASSNSPIASLSSPLATVANSGNDVNETQNSSPPSSSPSTPTPQSSSSSSPHQNDIKDDDADPSTVTITNNALVDNARSAASISNLINHDEEQRINNDDSSKSQPTSQMSSRSISPAPETPRNHANNINHIVKEQRFINVEFHNPSFTKKKRKGVHDNDENDIGIHGDFDSSKRQRCNLKNSSLSGEGNSDENTKVIINNGSAPPSPVTSSGFDETMVDDHHSDEYSGANSPTNSSVGNNINFATKQTRKKPYIPRPPNSFILYRQHHHPLILNQHPGINNSEISRIIAEHWRNLPNQEKSEWKRKAEEAKERHMKAWPDYKYQPRRRVVGPTFKKPLKGPGAPSSAIKSDDFSAQAGMMDNFVIELSKLPHRKMDNNDSIMESHKHPSVIIIEGGSKELNKLDRNGNNNSRKPSPAEAIKAKLGPPTQQRLPPPHTLVSPQLQSLSSSQQQAALILPTTPSSSSSSTSTTSSSSPRGALIVVEGSEDNTILQSSQLYEFLKNEGIKARLCKFPDTSTPSGSALRAYQSTNRQPNPKTIHLLVAAHWWELMPLMKEQLMNGITLIVDRYVYSAMAASFARGLDLNWCKSSYAQMLNPDLIFLLRMEREASEQQLPQLSLPHVNDVLGIGNDSDDLRMAKEWQRRVQDGLARLSEAQWKVLDAHKSNKIINAQIITASIEVIERCRKSNASYVNMFNSTIMPQQSQQLLPPSLVPASSQQSQYPSVNLNSSPPSNHSLLPLSHQQQKNSNVLPPIGRHGGLVHIHI